MAETVPCIDVGVVNGYERMTRGEEPVEMGKGRGISFQPFLSTVHFGMICPHVAQTERGKSKAKLTAQPTSSLPHQNKLPDQQDPQKS